LGIGRSLAFRGALRHAPLAFGAERRVLTPD
jgi:hypothetical protein